MASRKKAAPKAAVKNEVIEAVKVEENVAEPVAEVSEPVTEKVEETVAEETKPVEKKAAKKSVKADVAEDKAAKKPAKTAKAAEVSTSVVVEFRGDQYDMDKLIEAVKADWVAGGHRLSSIKTLNVYIKPEDYTVYYVINGKTQGKVWMQ